MRCIRYRCRVCENPSSLLYTLLDQGAAQGIAGSYARAMIETMEKGGSTKGTKDKEDLIKKDTLRED